MQGIIIVYCQLKRILSKRINDTHYTTRDGRHLTLPRAVHLPNDAGLQSRFSQ